ncbi:hypothetical protein NIES2098_14510 [Calothrix sp. NIES-2098]|nr:hypothetical protein NIES2098_14510 [Calothrix sp. NIES-2098]
MKISRNNLANGKPVSVVILIYLLKNRNLSLHLSIGLFWLTLKARFNRTIQKMTRQNSAA